MLADGGTAPAIAPVTPHPGRTTQLMYACSQGDLQQVQRILHEEPSTLRHLDRIRRTPLHYCAGGATTAPTPLKLPPGARLSHCADVLLMAAPELVHSRDQDGFTPLHLAVIAGNVQLVQFLLANGADVGCKDEEQHSVVHWATVCGETAALQAVLAAGAEVSSPDVHGGYPIHYAAQMCGSEKPELGLQVLHILLSTPQINVSVVDNDGRTPLLWASSAGSARAVLALVRAGAAVESSDKDGLTALHCAASRGHTDTLDTLLTLCGAQTDVIDSNGCTALHYSVTLGHADATALLLSHSADPNLQDRKGRSPGHCGCAKGQLETVKQLHAAGANLWLRTARGDLPLHEAAASGRRQLVKWLLDQRPSQVNARNNDGRGLLHLAALNDNADMCKILLDSGAAVNPLLRTSKNIFMTPLDCALQRGFRSTAKFLQLHGGVPASRLNTLRLTSEVTSNISAGSHLHIREDVTVFGGSSSEADVEDPQRSRDHRGRRKTVRRKLSYRHEKRSFSGSEAEKDSAKLEQEKLAKKCEIERRSKSRDTAVKKHQIDAKYEKSRKKKQLEISDTDTSPELRKDTTKKSVTSRDVERKSKRLQQDDSSHELSDTEKPRKITSDRERRKNKKDIRDLSPEEELKKSEKSRSSNEKQVPEECITKSAEDEIKKKSGTETTKKKSKKSDVSDAETQKNRISDSETHRKKSAEKKNQKEAPKEQKIVEETVKQELEDETEKLEQKLDLKPGNHEEKVLEEDVSKEKLELQKQVDETSTKIDKPDSAKSKKLEESLKEEETQLSASELPKDTNLPQELTEENVQLSSELVQPDQISLQSKLSEESPSKTILVEASVHHPPKELNEEDIQEETIQINEESKEISEETVSQETALESVTKEVKTEAQEEKIEEKTVETEEKEDKEEKLVLESATEDATVSETKTETQLQETAISGKDTEVPTEEKEVQKTADSTQEDKDVIGENKDVLPLEETSTSVPVVDESSAKETTETLDQTTENEEQKKEESKKELNIDLSLKKFEESAEQQNEADIGESEKIADKQKKYRRKKDKNGEEIEESSSASRESSSSESESKKSVKKAKPEGANAEHKSFKILRDDVAFEVIKDSPVKEKRVKKATKKRAKVEIPNESATSSPEMLESVRRSKSVPRQKETLILPSLTEKRPESNLSAPNLSFLSDNDQKSGSNSELDEVLSSASRKKRVKRRSKLRVGAKSAGSDYESSNLIDSGFEPSPRSSRIPKRKVMSERGVNMTSVTQQIQSNIRRYHMERKIFQHLLDLKRLQIRSGQANESVLVKRAIDNYHNSVAASVGAGRYVKKDFSYKSFEQFLYQSLRMLQRSPTENLRGLPLTPDNPLLCTQSTHRCLHATHAYTGIPCAAYLPKMNHHTMPKIGFTPRNTSNFLPQINSKGKSVTLELCHGNDKQVISLPADRLDHNKRYYVTFTVKGQEGPSPVDQEHTTSHRHAKSV